MDDLSDGFDRTRETMRRLAECGDVAPHLRDVIRAHAEALESCMIEHGVDSIMFAFGVDPGEEDGRSLFVASVNTVRAVFFRATDGAWGDEPPERREELVRFVEHLLAFDAGRRYQQMQVPDGA